MQIAFEDEARTNDEKFNSNLATVLDQTIPSLLLRQTLLVLCTPHRFDSCKRNLPSQKNHLQFSLFSHFFPLSLFFPSTHSRPSFSPHLSTQTLLQILILSSCISSFFSASSALDQVQSRQKIFISKIFNQGWRSFFFIPFVNLALAMENIIHYIYI